MTKMKKMVREWPNIFKIFNEELDFCDTGLSHLLNPA